MTLPPIRVVCADDNQSVLDAIAIRLAQENDLSLLYSLPQADELVVRAKAAPPDVVVLDLDMPGLSPFDAIRELGAEVSAARVLIFSGHMSLTTIDLAIEAGIWGYVSKTDGEDELVQAIRAVHSGKFVLSPEVRRAIGPAA